MQMLKNKYTQIFYYFFKCYPPDKTNSVFINEYLGIKIKLQKYFELVDNF